MEFDTDIQFSMGKSKILRLSQLVGHFCRKIGNRRCVTCTQGDLSFFLKNEVVFNFLNNILFSLEYKFLLKLTITSYPNGA